MRRTPIAASLFLATATQYGFAPARLLYPDIGDHAIFARSILADGGWTPVPYPIFHYAVVAIQSSGIDWTRSAFVATALFAGVASVVAWVFVCRLLSDTALSPRARDALAALVVIAAVWVAPISMFTYPRNYLGYVAINVYHNPTTIACRPFAIALFFLVSHHLLGGRMTSASRFAIITLTIAATLAKPSYVIALLPAVGLYLLGGASLSRRFATTTLDAVLSLGLPALAVVLVQAQFVYGSERTPVFEDQLTTGVIWAPFAVLGRWTETPFRDLFLSIAFPVAATIAYFGRSREKRLLTFAWIQNLVGIGYLALFAESGSRLGDGNFAWTAQLTQGVLFLVAIGTLMKYGVVPVLLGEASRNRRRDLGRMFVPAATLGLHFMSGVVFWFGLA